MTTEPHVLMTAQERDAAQKRCQQATPGEWRGGHLYGQCHIAHSHGGKECDYQLTVGNDENGIYSSAAEIGSKYDELSTHVIAGMWDYEEGGIQRVEDRDFCAHARTDLPRALSDLAVLHRLVGELVEKLEVSQRKVHCGEFHQWFKMDKCPEKQCKEVVDVLARARSEVIG